MNRLSRRLVLLFVVATVAPLAVTIWLATSLLERSLSYSYVGRLDELSRALEKTGREFYRQSCEALKEQALAGRNKPIRYTRTASPPWPAAIQEFWESGESERFRLAGEDADRLEYLVRRTNEVWSYSRELGLSMAGLADHYRQARQFTATLEKRDLRRGFVYTFLVLAAGAWLVSLGLLVLVAHRISRPIQQLTVGLSELAAGRLSTRLETERNDEVGRAIRAFNFTAEQLQQSRDRLVYFTQLASWQMLARKMAHEVKNSLTPIRLTMEEMLARRQQADRAFLEQAAQVVAEEIESLERRVRAFSEFAAEPALRPAPLDVNAAVEERVAFLRTAHPEVRYTTRLDAGRPRAVADEDLLKGILTNLLENAAEAVGPGGVVLSLTAVAGGQALIEVHDSGPGLSEEARRTLFEPTISFKKRGMGLGLSITRKNALLSGGDILLVKGELGGAGFRVALPLHAV
ncbi:MAG: ATP-binding protein [Acidobacteriota bacterium]